MPAPVLSLSSLTNDAEILESLGSAEGVPSGMKAIGYDNQNIIIRSAHGYYQVNLDILEWDEHEFLEANWSSTSEITKSLKKVCGVLTVKKS